MYGAMWSNKTVKNRQHEKGDSLLQKINKELSAFPPHHFKLCGKRKGRSYSVPKFADLGGKQSSKQKWL